MISRFAHAIGSTRLFAVAWMSRTDPSRVWRSGEDQLQFLARVSQLARQGLSRLTLPRDQAPKEAVVAGEKATVFVVEKTTEAFSLHSRVQIQWKLKYRLK